MGSDRDELVKYLELAHRLGQRPFFQTGSLRWELRFSEDPRTGRKTTSDDALDAVLPYIRRLYGAAGKNERGSYNRVNQLLRDHTTQSPEGERARNFLVEAGKQYRGLLRVSRYGQVMDEGGVIRPRKLLEDYLNAELLHGDEARADDWTAFHQMGLLDVVSELGVFYRRFAVGPYLILQDSSLS